MALMVQKREKSKKLSAEQQEKIWRQKMKIKELKQEINKFEED